MMCARVRIAKYDKKECKQQATHEFTMPDGLVIPVCQRHHQLLCQLYYRETGYVKPD